MIVRLVIKTGLVGGAVLYSRDLGVWGNSHQTAILYKDITSSLCPHVKKVTDKLPFEAPLLPESGEIRFLAKHYYNKGVKSTIHFIYMLPCYTGQMLKKGRDAISNALEAPPPK